jgi:hypothetical protein
MGTVRREFLDHVLFWNAMILNGSLPTSKPTTTRTQPRVIGGQTPLAFAGGHTVARTELNNVRWVSLPELGPAHSGTCHAIR